MKLLFYDFEVFKYDWMTVLIDPDEDVPYYVHNDPDYFKTIYDKYKDAIWIGYNSRHYDQYLAKGLICDFKPQDINDHIFSGQAGWSFSSLLRKVFLINYDVMPQGNSLKELEGYQGHSIYESSVPFNIDRPLTDEEIKEVFSYCENDVVETMNVFAENINDFTALLWLVKEFNFPLSYMSKTKAQISAEILECVKTERDDEFDISALDCINMGKYEDIKDWFLAEENHCYSKVVKTKRGKEKVEKTKLERVVAGVKHIFGYGGVHGAKEQYHYKCDKDHLMLHVDVESFYPRLMIWHNLLTRNAKAPEKFKSIFERRMQLKHEGKKKEQAPLKIVINGTFGICKDKTNKAYDPRNANLICINGQLMLIDLIDKLESVPSFELIQSNTDGLIIKIRKSDFDLVDDICYEWEERCDMKLGFDYVKEIWQKDVNNYIFVDYEGNAERKGGYVKELSPMDNDLPIINKALVDYMLNGTPVKKTIDSCSEYLMFQKISKLSDKYEYVIHERQEHRDYGQEYRYDNKCYRIFASKDKVDGAIYKVKGHQMMKFANTSEHSYIENGDITDAKIPHKLDKQWYIDLANLRLTQFGIN